MTRLKKVFIVLLLSFVLQSLIAQSTPIYKPQNKVKQIKDRGRIVVGMTATDQYPFYYKDASGELIGLDVEIAHEVANRLGVRLEINREAKSFNDLIPLVLAEKIDFASSKLSRTLTRSLQVFYTDPYLVFKQGLLINRIQLAKSGIDDNKMPAYLKLYNSSLGVIKNSSYERYGKTNFPKAKIVGYNTWGDAIDAIIKGEVVTIYRDELEIYKVLDEDPSRNLILKPVILKDQLDPIAIAVHPTDAHFVFFLNRVLESMSIEQDVKKLLEKYPK